MSKGSSDPMQGLVANGRVEDVPDEGMQNYADAPAPGDGGGIGNKVVDNTAKLGNTFLDGLKSLGAMFAGPAAAMSTAASKVTGAVGRTLNIGQGASKVVSLALVAALAGTGAVGVASVLGNDDITTVYVGTVDCKKAMDDAKRQYGFGERDIPEMVGDLTVDRSSGGFGSPYAVMMGRAGGINSNLGTEDRQVVMNAIGYANGQDQSVFYRSAGDYPHGQDSPMGAYSPFYYHDEDGFCRLGEYYILGVQPAGFGRTENEAANVGDWITFYFEDGQSFDTILVDTKGSASGPGYDFLNGTPMDTIVSLPDPQGLGRPNNVCGWGHCYDGKVNVFEFWSSTRYVTMGLGSAWDGKDLPADPDPIKLIAKSLDEPEGAPVVSFTNHGIAPEVQAVAEQFGMTDSLLGVALETQGAARANGMDKAADECKRNCPKTYDNSGIAQAAMSLSYSNMSGSGKPGTELYLEVMKKCEVSEPSMSCDRGVCTAVRWAGADDEYPVGITDDQLKHVEASDKWEEVTEYVPGSGKYDALQPGDVWVQHGGVNGHVHGHTSIYVGEELLKEHQFEGDADVGPVPDGAYSCSASLGDRALCVGMDDVSAINAKAFRCIEYETDSKYADGSIDSGVSVAASTGCNGSNKKSSDERRKIDGLTASTKLSGFVVPLKPGTYTVSCEWGDTSIAQHATGHSGIDLAASSGTEIAAAGPGTVSHVGYDPDGGMGNNVWIQHSNGMMTIYMHMSKHRAGIKVGDRVNAGDLIGYVGTTGDSTGPHLHFQVCSDYNYSNNVNPRNYFDF